MANQGNILAMDINNTRLLMVKENCRRLGIEIVKTQIKDSTILDKNYLKKADKVLVDVPCTGLGVFRRKPDLKWQTYDLKRFKQLSELQGKILATVSNYLKVGGRLVYSTCSTEPEENEEVVNKFLDKNPNFELESLNEFINKRKLKVYSSNQDKQKKFFQIVPGLSNLDLDGFFMAKMIRKG